MGLAEGGTGLNSMATEYSPMFKQGPGGGGISHSCSGFWDCAWFWMDWVGRTDLYWNYGMPDAGPSDPDTWNSWNQRQCEEQYVQMRHFVPQALGTGVACGALGADAGSSTPLCLAGLGTLADTNYAMGRSIVNCHSAYGPH